MFSLSGPQLKIVMEAARGVSVQKRSVFLERVAALVNVRGPDDDLTEVTKLAGTGLSKSQCQPLM
jgi:hypothetical protein